MQINISIDNIKFRQITLFENPIAKKYVNLMQNLIDIHGLDFDHRRCFYTYKTDTEIENDLDNAIQSINNFLKKKFLTTDKTSPNYFNDLHTGFEMLNKGYDDNTVLQVVATPALKQSIRDLNFCVHELEHGRSERQVLIQWNKEHSKRTILDQNDYLHATSQSKTHHVYLAYNEVGKNIFDLYHDNLPIDYPGLKNNHFVGPDIIFCEKDKPLFDNEFLQWCSKNEIDPFKPKNGLLNYPIGKFTTFCSHEQFTSKSKITAYEIVDK